MVLIVVGAEKEISVTLDVPNDAVSSEPFGTVAGVQLVAAFQSLLAESEFQVALPA